MLAFPMASANAVTAVSALCNNRNDVFLISPDWTGQNLCNTRPPNYVYAAVIGRIFLGIKTFQVPNVVTIFGVRRFEIDH